MEPLKGGTMKRDLADIRLTMDSHGLYQERVDQTKAEGNDPLLRATLAGTFHFDPADRGQALRVTNADTDGNVSVGGIAIRRVGSEAERARPRRS